MTVAENIKNTFKKTATDIRAIANRIGFLERSLNYLSPKVSVVRSDPDSDGIYRTVEFKRGNGTLIQSTRLEHDITLEVNGGVYNKRTTLVYNKAGTVVIDTTLYLLKYDSHGCIISETLIP
jgi:hypothetical protein